MFEPNFQVGRNHARWERLLFFIALIAVPAILSSCGSSAATTVTPTITISCTPSDVILLSTSQCTANVLNETSTLVNWTVSGTGTGSITSGGLYTAPGSIPIVGGNAANVVTITATSQVASTLTATQNLTLETPTAIFAVTCVDPNNNNLSASIVSSGNQLDCTATSSTGVILPVTWTIANKNNLGGNIGTISPQGGDYTAPLIPPPGQVVTITATTANSLSTMAVTVTVVFGNAVLKGPYAFSTRGRLPTHAFWARVGTFTAGNGDLSGIEDTNQGGTPNTVSTQRAFTGSYLIGPDGRGSMQFCEGPNNSSCPQGAPATAYFRIAVISTTQAQMIEFSSPTTSSATTTAGGEIVAQDPSVVNTGNNTLPLGGTYSFNFAGVSAAAAEESAAGEFNASGFSTNGVGAISAGSPTAPGELDINDGVSDTLNTLNASTYTYSSNGRGTLTVSFGSPAQQALTFGFYMVSANRAKFIEIDSSSPSSILTGDAFKQQTSVQCGWGPTALNGATLFQASGQDTTGGSPGVVIGELGSFSVSGTTEIFSGASLDENSGGNPTSQLATLSGSYTVGTPCGRGTLSVGSHAYVFYIISTSNAVLQETTPGINTHGFLIPSQGGTFTNGSFSGSYAFRFGGTDAAGTAGLGEDFLGQVTSSGSGMGLSGNLDLNDFATTQTGCVPLTTNCIAIANGTYQATPSVGLRATMALPLSTTPSSTRNLVLYMVSPSLFYALDATPSPAGTAIGVLNIQF